MFRQKSQVLRSRFSRAASHLVGLFLVGTAIDSHASTFQAGDITNNLGPTFFVDDASNGGSDTDIGHNGTFATTRLFDGLLTPNQGPTRLTISGFGFATHTSATANDATSIMVTFTYLGADAAVGGGDDVLIGSSTGAFTFVPSASNPNAEYYFAFPTPLSADLTITATRFRIQISPTNANHVSLPDTVLKLKSGVLISEPSVTSAKLSVAGVVSPLISPGRLNLAKFQPVTATSVNGQRLASYLTDGVVGNDNRWQGSSSTWQAAVIDFPFPVEVGSAQVFTGVDDTNPIASYSVQFWNGSAWTAIDGGSVSGNTSTERNLVFTNPVTASSFRFLSSEANLRVKELALYPPNGPTGFPLGADLTLNLAYQRPAVASAFTAGNFGFRAVDGRAYDASIWQTATAGVNTLDIDLRVPTKIGSAHIYSGTATVAPLAAFVLKYWDGSAWLDIPGASVTGNTTANLIDSFTPVTTGRVRLEFTNPGTTAIREISIFPANPGNVGYPIGTNLINSGPLPSYETYNDSFYLIENSTSGRRFSVPNSGQPALDVAGLTFGQSQYQVLLNLSNGTYRLRNRASGECLSGAQLDKTTGLLLTDSTYAAMPHQDWILDPLGGNNFRFINQWSGLAIDSQGGSTAQGTPLVQNTANGVAKQSWKIIKFAGSPKKGIGGSSFAKATNPNWAYNWGRLVSNPMPDNAPFHPMQWGNFNWDIGSNQGPIWQEYTRWRTRADGVHLMGFNEPDRVDQSNMTMEQVISLWPRLHELDLPLVSPSPGTIGGEEGWLDTFYTQALALGYRVDYTSVHTYPGPSGGSATNLINFINNAYTIGQSRPVWLTEFSFVDWGGNQSWSEEDNYTCLAEFLWRAESNVNLRKYALFIFTEEDDFPNPPNSWQAVSPAPRSNSYDKNGNLTAFGRLYAAWDGDVSVPPTTSKTYMVHNRGLRKRMANAGTTNTAPGGRTIRTDGRIVNWQLVPTGATNRYYMVSDIDGRRMRYVTASNPSADPSLAAPGTTGVDVEWSLTHNQHGWYYIGHPHTNTRLKLNDFNTSSLVADYQLVANTDVTNNTQWRFIVAAPQTTWTGATSNSWATATNWTSGALPTGEDVVNFEAPSTANLNTVLNQDTSVLGVRVISPSGPVTIGGTNTLTIGGFGIDLTAATRDLTINAPVVLDAVQGWTIANNRTLTIGGAVSGDHNFTIGGLGRVSFGASNVLPNGAGNRNLILNGNLNLNGTSQSVNGISGTGVIDNLAAGTATLTVGNNNTAITLPITQDTVGALSLVKTGSGVLTLPLAYTYTGGLTNNGTGNIVPQNNNAFGTGPVVMNAGTIYPSAADYTFANPLTLNSAILRIGGGNNRTLTWSGPITSSGTSSMNGDGSTTGVILSGGLNITGGTFSSISTGVANTISSPITGSSGTLRVSSGTLNLNAASTYSGTIRSVAGSLVIGNALAMQNATLDMNGADTGTISLNNLNATLGAITGSRSLSMGNGAITIGSNDSSTTYSGTLSGNASLTKSGAGTLTLSNSQSYAGSTMVSGGTLAVTGASLATSGITFSSGGSIRFVVGSPVAATNAAVNFANGTVSVSGTPNAPSHLLLTASSFVGTPVLASPVPGYALEVVGNQLRLTQSVTNPYDLWKTQITNGQDARNQDADNDGFSNLHEFLFGTSPNAGNGALVTTSASGNNLVLQWLQREAAATYILKQSPSLDVGSWTSVVSPVPAPDANQSGTAVNYDRYTVTIPTTGGTMFYRIEANEN